MAVSYAIAVACRQLVTESVNSGADSVCHALASQLYIMRLPAWNMHVLPEGIVWAVSFATDAISQCAGSLNLQAVSWQGKLCNARSITEGRPNLCLDSPCAV